MAAMQKFETEIKIQLDRAEKALSKSDFRLLLSEFTQDIDKRGDKLDEDELEDELDDEDEEEEDSDLEDWNKTPSDEDDD